MKSSIYNLIILDESGSMSGVKAQTIAGCNETLNTIRSAQKSFADTQEHFVSIFSFQADGEQPSRYLIKNAPIAEVQNINGHQYEPWGSTPLYDAIGSTLTDLKAVTRDDKLAIGSVTIITDGMENSSRQYTLLKVAQMIEALKELGWSFNFIGANIDVKATAQSLNIDNSLEFEQDAEGTTEMFAKERSSRMSWLKRSHRVMAEFNETCPSSDACRDEDLEEFRGKMRKASKDYFN